MKTPDSYPPPRTGRLSVLLFFLTIVVWLLTTLFFDAALGDLSLATQRGIGFLMLVAPPLVGVALGVASLMRCERPRTWAIGGLLLNGVTALFFATVLSFAG